MLPVEKALWYIESHSCEEIRLEDLAQICEVSPTYLSRLFPLVLGQTLRSYVRRRRLSEAARRLAEGAPDILELALAHGYGSHEGFTRAFRDEFQVTPESVRTRRSVAHLNLQEACTVNPDQIQPIEPLRMETSLPTTIAGIRQRYGNLAAIPSQWQRFLPYLGSLPQQVGAFAYGCCYNFDQGDCDYLCGVEVRSLEGLPSEFDHVRIPSGIRYAVFRHHQHVARVSTTWNSIFSHWLPRSGYQAADAPSIERYGPEFDGRTGEGGLEIWVPLQT